MRKIALFFASKMTLLLLASLFVLSANAFAATVSIPASTGDNGLVYDIPVNIDNATGVAGYQFTITYDTAVLNCTTALRGSLTGGFDAPSNVLTPGRVVTLSIEPSLTELTGGSGSLALIRCTVTGAGGTSTSLHFVPDPASILSNGNGDAIAATYVDGSFMVNGGCVPSTEVCDGLDNDCDALIDEDLTRPTSCGVGACGGTGLETCTMGVWGSDTCAPGDPATEGPYGNLTCEDMLDNDCDGTADAADTGCSASGILPVRIAGTTPVYYQTIGAAYNAAVNADIIEVRAADFTENLVFNRNVPVTLKGGYDQTYGAVSGMTTVIGGVTIGGSGSSGGALTVGGLIVH